VTEEPRDCSSSSVGGVRRADDALLRCANRRPCNVRIYVGLPFFTTKFSTKQGNRRSHFARAVHSHHPVLSDNICSEPSSDGMIPSAARRHWLSNDPFCSKRVTLHCQWGKKTPKTACPFPLGFRHRVGGRLRGSFAKISGVQMGELAVNWWESLTICSVLLRHITSETEIIYI